MRRFLPVLLLAFHLILPSLLILSPPLHGGDRVPTEPDEARLALERAGALAARGEREEAVALLGRITDGIAEASGPVVEEAWLALGSLHLEAGRADLAQPLLERARRRGGSLQGWATVQEVRALVELDRTERARALLEEPPTKTPMGPAVEEILLLRGRLRLESGSWALAAQDLTEFLARAAGHPEVRSATRMRAEALEKADRLEEALEAWWRIWWEDPGSPHAEEARDRARSLAAESEELALPSPSPREILAHGRRLRAVGRGVEAAEVLTSLAAAREGEERGEALLAAADALYASWKSRESLEVVEGLLRDPGQLECPARALQARLLWIRLNRSTEALELARRQAESCPWSTRDELEGGEEGAWIAANIQLRAGKEEAAGAWFRRLQSRPSRRAQAAAWTWGITLTRAGRHKEALETFAALLDRARAQDQDGYVRAALYWRARNALLAGGDGPSGEAREHLRELVSTWPRSYYGHAGRRLLEIALGEQATPQAVTPPSLPDLEALAADGSLSAERALRLERAGLVDLAGRELLSLAEGQETGPVREGLVLRAAVAYAPTRWAARGVRLVRKELAHLEDRALEGPEGEELRRAFFPRPFWELYLRETRRQGLEPALPLAISRQESLFDPEIRSWAGAVGLMQLMPATAADEARRAGLAPPRAGTLVDPALNIRLGVQHLARLVDRFGSEASAVAAYNAGGGRVAGWLEERPLEGGDGLPQDLWIDSIPITQTRLYVKGVLRSAWEYRRLYESAGGTSASGGRGGARIR